MDSTIKDIGLLRVIKSEKGLLISIFAFTYVLLFFCSKLSPFFDFNNWSDVNIYFTMGKGLMNGLVPYRDLFDHKGPLVFLLYGLGYLVSHNTFFGVYLIDAFFIALGAMSAYLLGRHYLNKVYSFFTALGFSLLYLFYSGFGGAAEDFVLGLQMLSLLLFIRYFSSEKQGGQNPKYMFVHGIVVSLVLFIKLNLLVFFVFLLLAVVVNMLVSKQYKSLLYNLLYFVLGSLVVWIPLLAYFAANSALYDLYNGYIAFNAQYSNTIIQIDFLLIKKIIVRAIVFAKDSPFYFGSGVIAVLVFVFTSAFLKSIYARIGLLLSFLSLLFFILIPPAVMQYYYISLAAFSVLFLVAFFFFLQKRISVSCKWYVLLVSTLIAIALGCFYKACVESENLYKDRRGIMTVEEYFSGIILSQRQTPTLLSLGLDKGLSVFTKAYIVPNVKYYFHPNIYHENCPIIRNSQDKYIANKQVLYIIIADEYRDFDYYMNMNELKTNYKEIARYNDEGVIYFLYKRID